MKQKKVNQRTKVAWYALGIYAFFSIASFFIYSSTKSSSNSLGLIFILFMGAALRKKLPPILPKVLLFISIPLSLILVLSALKSFNAAADWTYYFSFSSIMVTPILFILMWMGLP